MGEGGHSDAAALDAIAGELYSLPPARFTAARNAQAGLAAPALGREVRALRKPTVAAYAVNLLVRDGRLTEAVELSAALRDAQDDLDAAELARLGAQRRALVAALAAQAADLAEEQGVAVSASAREDVQKTINAAVMDAASAAAVMTGRLVTGLVAGEQADLHAAVGGSVPGVGAPPPRDDLAERRAAKAAERAAREAERAASDAERALSKAEARRAQQQERVDHVRERMDDLRRDLERLGAEADAAEQKLAELEQEQQAAASVAREAAARADAARRALDA